MKRLLGRLRALLPRDVPARGGTSVSSIGRAPEVRSARIDTVVIDPTATCLDLRSPELQAVEIVTGSLLLSPAEALRLVAQLPRPLRLLAATDAEAATLALALSAAGHPDVETVPGGLAAWRAAGWALHEPAWKSPLPPGHAIRQGERRGWVQNVRWEGDEFRFDVSLVDEGGLISLRGLREEELESCGRRGAAGFGELS